MQVTIVGTGNMARAIGGRALVGGYALHIIARDVAKANALAAELKKAAAGTAAVSAASLEPGAVQGDIVVQTVPYPAFVDVLTQLRPALKGKVVVDITNSMNPAFVGPMTPPAGSLAEEVQKLLGSDARVVKAFNTTVGRTLMAGQVGGPQSDVFIAGDDAPAKAMVGQLVSDAGLHPVDVGPLCRARQLEQLGFLGIMLQQPLGSGFMSGWKLLLP
jgi:8-hydroxy-5-deazaflavin:NADPH oxidoreductase